MSAETKYLYWMSCHDPRHHGIIKDLEGPPILIPRGPSMTLRLNKNKRGLMREISYDLLPEHMRAGARRYIEDGIPPGDFMLAVLTNNFKEACARADDVNKSNLISWATWLVMECPFLAQGSEEAVRGWVEACGLGGFSERWGKKDESKGEETSEG